MLVSVLETPNRHCPVVRILDEPSYTKIRFNGVSSEEALGGLYFTINDKSSRCGRRGVGWWSDVANIWLEERVVLAIHPRREQCEFYVWLEAGDVEYLAVGINRSAKEDDWGSSSRLQWKRESFKSAST